MDIEKKLSVIDKFNKEAGSKLISIKRMCFKETKFVDLIKDGDVDFEILLKIAYII